MYPEPRRFAVEVDTASLSCQRMRVTGTNFTRPKSPTRKSTTVSSVALFTLFTFRTTVLLARSGR